MDDDKFVGYRLMIFYERPNAKRFTEHVTHVFPPRVDMMDRVWNSLQLGALAFGEASINDRIITDVILEEMYLNADLEFEFYPAGFTPKWIELIEEFVKAEEERREAYTADAAKKLAQSLVGQPQSPITVKHRPTNGGVVALGGDQFKEV